MDALSSSSTKAIEIRKLSYVIYVRRHGFFLMESSIALSPVCVTKAVGSGITIVILFFNQALVRSQYTLLHG